MPAEGSHAKTKGGEIGMTTTKQFVIKERRTQATVSWDHLQQLILDYVISKAETKISMSDIRSFEIIIKQKQDGSPPYNVNAWLASVNIVSDLTDTEIPPKTPQK